MYEIFEQISSRGEVIPLLAVVTVFATLLLISLTAIISRCIYKIRSDATAAQLKRDMLDRGMSAEEIKTVLEAGPKK
jgi:hypothetical protein